MFGQKLLNIQHGVGRCAHKSLIMRWANASSLKKINSVKPNAASHNNASWCTDTDGVLGARPPEDNSSVLGVPPYLSLAPLIFHFLETVNSTIPEVFLQDLPSYF